MGSKIKYGFCPMSKKWIKRGHMRAVNVYVYSDDGEKEVIRIRVAKELGSPLVKYLRSLTWDGTILTRQELEEKGIWPDRSASEDCNRLRDEDIEEQECERVAV